jgi:hypothetical protein
MRAVSCPWVLFAFLLFAGPLDAQDPPLTDEDYRIDFHQGPVMGSARVIGMGGAYTAIAEKSVGLPFNPASVSHRLWYSTSGFDFDVTLDWVSPGIFQGQNFDFDNNGHSRGSNLLAFVTGGDLQFKSFALGAFFQGERHRFRDQGSPSRRFEALFGVLKVTGGYGFFGHQLLAGAGVRLGMAQVQERDVQGNSFKAQTAGLELGALLRPRDLPFRIGAALTVPGSESATTEAPTVPPPTAFYLPRKGIGIPLEFCIGAAYSFGTRPFNIVPAFLEGKVPPLPGGKEGEGKEPNKEDGSAKMPGFELPFLILSFDLLISGPVGDAIGTDGFLDQVRERSGKRTTFSPRAGAETEIWPDRLRLRAGTYWEPSRFQGYAGRLHATFGFELRVLDFKVFGADGIQVCGAVDLAERYSNISLSIGLWH